MARLPAAAYRAARTALAETFNLPDLGNLLRDELGVGLNTLVNPTAVGGTIDEYMGLVVEWAERTDQIGDLLAAARRVRPRSTSLADAYEKMHAGERLVLQHGGKPVATGLGVPGSGLERQIKDHLPAIDVGLWREQLARLEPCVCRVEMTGRPFSVGTAFLVGPDLVLTNYHVVEEVIKDPSKAKRLGFRFDYRRLANKGTSTGMSVACHKTDWLVEKSPYTEGEGQDRPDATIPTADELDYALVRLDRPVGTEPVNPAGERGLARKWIPLTASSSTPPEPQAIFILQFPWKEPLQIALDTNGLQGILHDGRRIRYSTTTAPGSSGSPCFDLQWSLIALHHYGDPEGLGKRSTFSQGSRSRCCY